MMTQEERILAARASRQKWVQKNREKERERNRRWFRQNKLWAAVRSQNRYAAMVSQSDETFTVENIEKLFDWFGNKCLNCGSVEKVTIDHVIPLSLGGLHSIYNIQPLCQYCNCSKKNRSSDDYRDLTAEDVDAILSVVSPRHKGQTTR